jgi:LmbE family N-acetylglucosaminyl deacetylase
MSTSILEIEGPVLILSTHLDDAVLSCTDLLRSQSSPAVATVFAGAPAVVHKGYNSECTGQSFAPDAMRVRRDEDLEALNFLGATPIWLDLFESDYAGFRPSVGFDESLQSAISQTINDVKPTSVFLPLGLIHPDHVALSKAGVALIPQFPVAWYMYLDLPYGAGQRWVVMRRRVALRRQVRLRSLNGGASEPGLKQRAMSFYQSQYEVTRQNYREGFDIAMHGGERYWRAERAF